MSVVPDSVISFLLQNLSRLLSGEIALRSGVKEKIRSLRNELEFIEVFLKSSEGKRNDKLVKVVVKQIRDVAHKTEDVIDIYIANIVNHRSRNIIGRLVHCKSHVVMLHDVNAEIQTIKGTIDEIYKNRERYGIGEGEFQSEDDEAIEILRRRRRDVEENEVVGFVHDSGFVIDQLLEGGSSRNVVSIIGMGGLGKTTLARKIYNDNRVKELFDCRAWGYVSNEYRAKELLLSLLKCLLSKSEYNDLFKKREEEDNVLSDSEEELKKKVHGCLNEKKYLVVIDDIWKTEVWDEIQCVFPDDHQSGSRILITSRIKEVASYTGTLPPYYLPFLNNEESWTLFSKKVFRGEECPSSLEPSGRSIVESCRGLPLVIIVLAGLVAKKERSPREWLRIKDHVKWHLAQDKNIVMDILKISYDSLPRVLKLCFLYFGIYPEDYEINARQLMQRWIAEGLIQPPEIGIPDPPELEDVAENYLDELVDRSLIQMASRRTDGGVKTCRIHDLLRELCISEGKANKFLEVCTKSSINSLSNPRRLSLHCKTQFYISSTGRDHMCTRSLFFFADDRYSDDKVSMILKDFKLARVLDFGKSNFYSIPSDLKKLIHLRYLRMEHDGSTHVYIPSAIICCLWNLETLDVRGWYAKNNWSGIWNLKCLRHFYTWAVRLPADVSKSDSKIMWNLQTLNAVIFNPQTASLMSSGKFPKLRKLGLSYDSRNTCSMHKHLQSLHSLSNLRTLKIFNISSFPSLENVFPSNLAKITLKRFDVFDCTTMNTLGRLPNLQILKIKGHIGQAEPSKFELNCVAGEFSKLQVFEMANVGIESWRLNTDAMPCLQRLEMQECNYLNELPEELWYLTTLQEVEANWPSQELRNKLQNVEVKNGCKITIYPPP